MENKFVRILIAAVIAFGLWVYVITAVSPGSESIYYNVPVVLEGTALLSDRGLMITSSTNNAVTLVISGNRSDLNKVNSGNITLIANLAGIYEAGEKSLSYTVSFPGDIPSNALIVQSKNPGRASITVENRISREVPVEIEYSGSVPEGFISDRENAVLDYSNIMISGPQSVIDQITKAKIQVDLANREESLSESYRYTLCDKDDNPVDSELVTTNVTEVHLDLRIQRVKEIGLVLKVVDGGGATEATSKITIEPASIQVSGNSMLLDGLTTINLGTVNLGEVTKDTVLTYPIVLPEGLTNLSGVTEAKITIRFPDLLTREFSVTNIRAVNIPEGLEADILTQVLPVYVRGPKDLVNAMTVNDVIVTVNFAGYEIGTSTLKANISVSSKYSSVGTVGTYSVSATLREPILVVEEPEETEVGE